MLNKLKLLTFKHRNKFLFISFIFVVVILIIFLSYINSLERQTTQAATTLSTVVPSGGVSGGGTKLRIFGTDFNLLNQGNLSVSIGASACTSPKVESSTELTCLTPAGSGQVDVTVTDGTFNQTLSNAFNYLTTTETDLALFYDPQYSYPNFGQTVYDLSSGDKYGYLGQNELVGGDEPTVYTNPHRFIFDGINDMIDTTLNSDFANNLTLEVWFRRDTNSNINEININERLISTYQQDTSAPNCDFGSGDSGEWSFGGNACTNRLAIGIDSQTVQAKTNGTSTVQTANSNFIPNNLWQHVTLTYDSATFENNIYINGVLHSTYNQEAASPSEGVIKLGTFLEGKNNFDGDISVVRIYGRDLNSSEIEFNYDQDKNRFEFDESTVLISNLPSTINFGSVEVSPNVQTVSSVLNDITFQDRRSNFVPWSATITSTDLNNGSDTIAADNVFINPTVSTQTVITGSGNNNINGTLGYFTGAGVPRTLFENTAINGGGEFRISPEIGVDVPAFSRTGAYSSTITVSVS